VRINDPAAPGLPVHTDVYVAERDTWLYALGSYSHRDPACI